MKQLAVITLLSLLTISQSFAQRGGMHRGGIDRDYGHHRQAERVRIPLHLDEHMRGQNIIKLKQELKYQNPGINVKNLDLVAVRVVAKSKKGRGEATLVVGQSASYPQNIAGNQRDFHSNAGFTFDKFRIDNPSYDSQGKWQLELRGNVKVKKVVIIADKKMRRGRIQSVMIPMYGEHSRGLKTIPLKRLIKQQMPGVNLQNAKLVSVNVMAKSKHGNGQASLVVGHNISYPATIPGRPRAFRSVAPRSFTPVSLRNTNGTSQGKWQVELQGNIKVQHIMVNLKLNSPARGIGRPGRIGRR